MTEPQTGTGGDLACDICVIGAGSGGLSVAAGAVQMGARTVLIEKGKMGGDCLNYGCVPSKSLIAAAHKAHAWRTAPQFGVTYGESTVDMARVRAHVRDVIAAIEPHDSVERFEDLGVTVIKGAARFTGADTVQVDERRIRAKRFVVATGSSPMVPPVPGLDTVPFMTNETVFDLDKPVRHLLVMGGGPIGAELAQAHRRLGAEVTVIEMIAVLGKDDPECAALVKQRLTDEGVTLLEGTAVTQAAMEGDEIVLTLGTDGATRTVRGSHLLVAAGRRPNIDGLDLRAAGIDATPAGIAVDARLRTSNKRIFAIGDVAGGYQFTHVAGYHAGIVIRNALFRLPARADHRAVPWVTYTDPELAHVGLTEAAARQQHGDRIKVLRWPFAENDRAQAERATDGMIKVVVDRRGRVLGATIVGPTAGELLLPWVMTVQRRGKIGPMASVIAPYPTLGEVSKRAAGAYYTPSLFSERTRRIVRFLLRFP